MLQGKISVAQPESAKSKNFFKLDNKFNGGSAKLESEKFRKLSDFQKLNLSKQITQQWVEN